MDSKVVYPSQIAKLCRFCSVNFFYGIAGIFFNFALVQQILIRLGFEFEQSQQSGSVCIGFVFCRIQ